MGVNITTIVYLRVLIIQIGSTIILMVVEAQGIYIYPICSTWYNVNQVKIPNGKAPHGFHGKATNNDTVDGWNPAPPGMYETPKTMG